VVPKQLQGDNGGKDTRRSTGDSKSVNAQRTVTASRRKGKSQWLMIDEASTERGCEKKRKKRTI